MATVGAPSFFLPLRSPLQVQPGCKSRTPFRAQSPGGPEALPSRGCVPLRPGQARPTTVSPADSALSPSEVLEPAKPWILNSKNILPTRSGSYLLQGPPHGGHQTSHPRGGGGGRGSGVHLAAFTRTRCCHSPLQWARIPLAPREARPAENGRAVLTTRPRGTRARSGTTAY